VDLVAGTTGFDYAQMTIAEDPASRRASIPQHREALAEAADARDVCG